MNYVIDDGQNKIPGYSQDETNAAIVEGIADNLNGENIPIEEGSATSIKQAINNKIGMDMTPLYTNSTYVPAGGHLDLSEKPSLFRFLLIRFQTNAEFCTQLINSNDTTSSFAQTIMANSTSGQVTYPLTYNASMQGKIDDTNKRIDIVSNVYNNQNYQIRITNVWGVSRK